MATASAVPLQGVVAKLPRVPRALAPLPARGRPGRAGAKRNPRPDSRAPALKTQGTRHEHPSNRIRRAEDRSRTHRSIPRRAAPPLRSHPLPQTHRRQNPNRSHHEQGDRRDPRALPPARTTAVSNPVSISNSGPRSPSSGLDPNARTNHRHPRARSAAADRRRSSRSDLARPVGDRLVIAALGKVLQTRSYDRAPLGPRDGEALGPGSGTARLHDRLVITTDKSRPHSLNASHFLFAPSPPNLRLMSEGEKDGYR